MTLWQILCGLSRSHPAVYIRVRDFGTHWTGWAGATPLRGDNPLEEPGTADIWFGFYASKAAAVAALQRSPQGRTFRRVFVEEFPFDSTGDRNAVHCGIPLGDSEGKIEEAR